MHGVSLARPVRRGADVECADDLHTHGQREYAFRVALSSTSGLYDSSECRSPERHLQSHTAQDDSEKRQGKKISVLKTGKWEGNMRNVVKSRDYQWEKTVPALR